MKLVVEMGEGAAQHNISLRDLGEISWVIPRTCQEQHRIATSLQDLDSEIATLQSEIHKYECIKQGMAHDLLTGKVRLV
jgi:type I restriction enzyme S subunit